MTENIYVQTRAAKSDNGNTEFVSDRSDVSAGMCCSRETRGGTSIIGLVRAEQGDPTKGEQG